MTAARLNGLKELKVKTHFFCFFNLNFYESWISTLTVSHGVFRFVIPFCIFAGIQFQNRNRKGLRTPPGFDIVGTQRTAENKDTEGGCVMIETGKENEGLQKMHEFLTKSFSGEKPDKTEFDILVEYTQNQKNGSIPLPLGFEQNSSAFIKDIATIPHMLICGVTGAGKTAFLQTLLTLGTQIKDTDSFRFIIYSSKMDYSFFNGTPHLYVPVITDTRICRGAFTWFEVEIRKRLKDCAEANVNNLAAYNRVSDKPYSDLFFVVDDLYNVLTTAKEEDIAALISILINGRQAGVHCILVTSYPADKILQQRIMPVVPCKICFTLSSEADSKAILGIKNATKLTYPGEMIYKDLSTLKQLTAIHTDYDVLKKHLEWAASKYPPIFVPKPLNIDEITEHIYPKGPQDLQAPKEQQTEEKFDELISQAAKIVIDLNSCSVSMLQRRMSDKQFRLGYSRAARIVDQLEELGVVGQYQGAKPRDVLIDLAEWERIAEENDIQT